MSFLGDKRSIVQLITFAFATVFAGCNQTGQKTIVQKATTSAKPQLIQPFRFHKMVEVSPGNSFDVLSWGRGPAETGSFLILASDSAEAKYTTTTGDLDGTITDVFNTDMDVDGNPEILIQAKSKDSTVRSRIYAFEYKDNKAQKLDFPKLNQSQKKGYRGEDNFYIKGGVLMREFPVFEGSGTKPTAEKRILEYGLRSNSFTVKTVSKEDEVKKQNAAADTAKKSAATTPVSSVKNTSQKKHHVSERRHHSSKKTSHKRSSQNSRSGKKHRRHRR